MKGARRGRFLVTPGCPHAPTNVMRAPHVTGWRRWEWGQLSGESAADEPGGYTTHSGRRPELDQEDS